MASAPLTAERICPEPPAATAVPLKLAATVNSPNLTAGVLISLTTLYALLVAPLIARRLWFDELFTYYIAQAPTLPRLFDALAHTDLNPPLIYFAVRLFHKLFGTSELVTRLPSCLAFYTGCVLTFLFLKRRIGVWWSAAAILLFWSTPYFRYSAEARPYGFLVAFFALLLISYDAAGRPSRKAGTVAGIAAGSTGLMLSHIFAPLSILPFCVAELVRSVNRRRIDGKVWAALLLPLTIGFAYIPAARTYQKILFPPIFQASPIQILYFFERIGLMYLFPWVFAAIVGALIAARFSEGRARTLPGGMAGKAWALTLLLMPLALDLALMTTGGSFAERYCITTALTFEILLAIGLAYATGFRRSSAVVAVLVLAIGTPFNKFATGSHSPLGSSAQGMPPDLPVVATNGLTFLEMDRYWNGGQKRLYYLVDRASAARYSNSTMFENMPLLTHYFPIRSSVAPYGSFMSTHKHFLVITLPESPDDWLLLKLHDDRAKLTPIQTLPGPDKDFLVFDVHVAQ